MVWRMVFQRVFRLLWAGMLVFAGLANLPADAAPAADLAAGGGAVVVAAELNLRGGPGPENPVVDVLTSGTALRLLAGPANDGWWRVTDGRRAGYVDGAWIEPATAPDDSAAFDLDLELPFHRQETPVWCDPADLQTWIEYDRGQPLGDSVSVQQSLWDWELGHNAGFTEDEWNASPFAVASAAQQWVPDRGFNHFIYDDPVQATATMAWLLANPEYREPSIALIWWSDHYVLVRGVRATADPFLNYPQAEVLGVYVMDPNRGSRSWLGEDRYVPLDEWVLSYLTPVTYLTPHSGVPGDVWQDRYVTVQRDWSNEGPTFDGRVNASPQAYSVAGSQ